MQYFPIFVDGQQLNVLVVGGGEVATRKVELMLKTPAKITVVSPEISASIARYRDAGQLTHLEGRYDKSLLDGQQLVFVATADNALNTQISRDAKAAKVLANVVDSPSLCHFITPSIIDRSPMVLAISSEGQSPVLVRYWRERLETLWPQAMGRIARFAGDQRQRVKQRLDSLSERRRLWELFFASSEVEKGDNLDENFEQMLDEVANGAPRGGELLVVQAPEDPDCLSLAGLRNMQKADIAVYDQGVGADIIELVRRDAEREPATEALAEQLQQLLADGMQVCYLVDGPLGEHQAMWQSVRAAGYPIHFFNSAPA